MLTEQPITQFQASLHGKLIQPKDTEYDISRKVYNGMFDKHPAIIVKCADVDDVIMAINFARQNDLLVAVKGGGHNAAGLGMCDDGLVIDLSLMKAVYVDVEKETALVQAGCTLGDIDHATYPFGMTVPSGIASTTGISGLTLGGGLGHLTRQCGLSIDNLLEAEVVLADGSFVKASATENTDLFWALRGGGGNFGVVTSFLFRVWPISTVYAGPMLWQLEESKEVMRWYSDFIKSFLSVPPGEPFPKELHLKKMCGIVWCYTGPLDKAEEVFDPIRNFKTPALDLAGPIPVPALQSMFDPILPPGMQWYWKADFVNELSDEAIDLHIKHGSQMPTWQSTMHLYPINGAASRVGKNETAWNYRDATWAMVIAGIDPDPANKDILISWARDYWTALHSYSAGGAYVNFMMDEGEDRVKATYGDNYERLAKIKSIYDPGNLFRVNQNIMPAIHAT
ncbi:MAG: FAD-binding oxidoreductase [Ferruginibacter sp.]